jgi:hypothetical protein
MENYHEETWHGDFLLNQLGRLLAEAGRGFRHGVLEEHDLTARVGAFWARGLSQSLAPAWPGRLEWRAGLRVAEYSVEVGWRYDQEKLEP